jgi:hypothetical protein
MSLNDAPGDVEAKPYAPSIVAPHLPESLEDCLEHMGRYAGACIVNHAAKLVCSAFRLNAYFTAPWREL